MSEALFERAAGGEHEVRSAGTAPGVRYVDWDFEDPEGRPLEEVRATREEIERRVTELVGELNG